MPDDDPLPPALDVGASVRDKTVYLALPIRKAGATDYIRSRGPELARYLYSEAETRDSTGNGSGPVMLQVGDLAMSLRVEGEPLSDLACIPLAHIVECRADKKVQLDPGFIPTVLRAEAGTVLRSFLQELQGLLHHRAEEYALRATASGRAASELADYLLLQVCNRYEPLITHWATTLDVHPEDFYAACITLAGELSTFVSASRRPVEAAPYQHAELRQSFEPLIFNLRKLFGTTIDRVAEQIPLTVRAEIGMWHGVIADKTLIDSAVFVLGVRADMPGDQIQRYFPSQSRIATVEEIRRYIMELIPGVPLRPLPQVPRQIPLHAGSVYFELDTRSQPWKQMRTSGGIAIHVSGQFPGIALELWAIRV
jgi:type VI secretion system protein ImpJ